MKILLINPPYTNFEGIKESGGHMMPLSLAYLAGYLRERIKCKIGILDAETKGLDYQKIKESIKANSPDLIGITCPTPTINHALKIAQMAKEINGDLIVVAGGAHPTAMPEMTVQNHFIDFAVIGEGEVTFYELVKMIQERKTDFHKINGLCFQKEDKTISTSPRELISDIDKIPFPARDLFELDIYSSASTKKVSNDPAGPILTSRGCAFNCIHCPSKKIWRGVVRFRSVQNIIAEIEECIQKFGIKEFNIFDDTFTLNEKKATQVCEEIIKRNLGISWVAFSRANTISKKLAKKMKLSGCKKISFGLESGSQKILDLMRKQTTVEMGKKAVAMVTRQGILAHASFMFGNIGETEETIKKTIQLAKNLPLDNATFFIASPFPGTELYEIAKKRGHITAKTKWEEFAPLTNTPPILVQENVSKERLVYWQKRAFREFYLRPKYIFRKLKQMDSMDDLKMLFSGLGVFFRIIFQKKYSAQKYD